MNLSDLTPGQLRKAASIKDKIQVLQKKLSKVLGNQTTKAPTKTKRERRKMSAAGRAAISAAQKVRWAKIQATKAK